MVQVELTYAAEKWMHPIFDDVVSHWYEKQKGGEDFIEDECLTRLAPWAFAIGYDTAGEAGRELPDVKFIKSLAKKNIFEATEKAVGDMITELKYWEGYCADLCGFGDATPLEASNWSRSCRSNHEKMQAALDQHRQDFFNGETSRTFEDAEYAFSKALHEWLNE